MYRRQFTASLGCGLFLPSALSSQSNPTTVLRALFEQEWEYDLRIDPSSATFKGDSRYNHLWPDESPAAHDRRAEHNRDVLNRLLAIDRAKLPPKEQINYDLFQREYEERLMQYRYGMHLIPLNQRGGIQSIDDLASMIRFDRRKDFEDWLSRLRALPAYVDQTIALLREGIRRKVLLPRIVLARVPAQIDKQIVTDPEASPFYQPFKKKGGEALAEAARKSVLADVAPAYRKLKQFFETEYLPASFEQVGIWQIPDGDKYYAEAVKLHTTVNITPAEVHETGLREVARIKDEMYSVMKRAGFTGTLKEFFAYLRSDTRFYYTRPEELLDAYRAIAKRIDPELVRVFRVLPRTPYGVEPIPASIAPDTTTAYYKPPAVDGSRAGMYCVNLYRPEVRPKWEMMALSLHEAVPGHHLQISLAQEQEGDVPKFRRDAYYNAFGEGWGLYAESLGDEMGLYDDPYAKFGQLTYEMWRALRLVVDTGMHHMKWDRQKAIDYFVENAAKQEADIINEIDRYIAWPGQALSYKIGQMKIRSLREKAQRELGAKFDVRDFHNAVLSNGSLPLDLLERQVDTWIKSRLGG